MTQTRRLAAATPENDTAAVILAAGPSSRMGRPKATLPWDKKTLLGHAVATAEAAGCAPVVVVLGAAAGDVAQAVPPTANVVVNGAWADGMGGSIARGLAAVRGGSATPGRLLVLPCDLPHVAADDLRRLIDAAGGDRTDAAAASFADTVGPPVVFTAGVYDRVAALTGTDGGKDLLKSLGDRLARVDVPAAARDVDTPDDYESSRRSPSPKGDG